MDKNQNGIPVCPEQDTVMPMEPHEGIQLAMVYAPKQSFRRLFSEKDALKNGTLFEELYKPLEEV